MKTGHSISGHILSTAYRISTVLCADIPLGVNHSPATRHDINKCLFLREPQCSPHKVPRQDSNRRPAGSTAGASLQPYGAVPALVLLTGQAVNSKAILQPGAIGHTHTYPIRASTKQERAGNAVQKIISQSLAGEHS